MKRLVELLLIVATVFLMPIQIATLIWLCERHILPVWFTILSIVLLPSWCVVTVKSCLQRMAVVVSIFFFTVATAAPLPPLPSVPVVKRPKPLLSPAHSVQPKSKPMVKATTFSPASELPHLPMTMEFVVVSNQFGRYLFTASALQPANNALSFETSPTLGDWQPMAHFGPVPESQTSFVSHYSDAETIYVRARLIPIPPTSGQTQTGWMPAGLVPVVGTAGKVYKNPNLPDVRTWSVKK